MLGKQSLLHRSESYEAVIKKAKMTTEKPHPLEELLKISETIGHDLDTVEFANHMDSIDPLKHLREEFHYPKMKTLSSGIVCKTQVV